LFGVVVFRLLSIFLSFFDPYTSSLGEDLTALKSTIEQLPRLTCQQLLHTTKNYRPEVGEKGLNRDAMKFLVGLTMDPFEKKNRRSTTSLNALMSPTTPTTRNSPKPEKHPPPSPQSLSSPTTSVPLNADEDDAPENLLMDPVLMLPFHLPTSTDMLVSFGAGIGGVNRERAQKYWPSVPPEFLSKLDFSSREGERRASSYAGSGWREGD